MTGLDLRGELMRASALLDLGRAAEARARLAAVLAADPQNAFALRMLARCHHAAGDMDGAIHAAQAAVAVDPTSEHGHRILANAYNSVGDRRSATSSAREALRLAPDEWRCHWLLAECLRHSDPNAALPPARRARDLAPNEADVHVLYGVVVKQLGRTQEARAAYMHALSINPNLATAHNNIAVLDRANGRWAHALAGFRTSLRHNPQQKLARENLANTIVLLLRRLCVAAYAATLVVVLAAGVVGPGVLRGLGITVTAGLLAGLGWILATARRSVGPFATTVLRTDRRALIALAVFAVTLMVVVIGSIVQIVPPHAVRSAFDGLGSGSRLLPFVSVGLLIAARNSRNVRK
ncbi:tetratricopeptide repeat protein [Actinocrinis puniceicyclus]|uniref:Tetratricopeptide repeat protein n=1 Tax=Actinocrinis puniceicyclus TaxID=977794 RepID=A0A8J7WNN7_9ACTN|nr:tetratricopeptide repeat protein [Actinocrinis puniceicyclus]MBS2963149.1 tetratricopeptide repeat protein [Actinocrinis puniceicyclus]